jgi:hydrogenase small subunit
VVSVDGNYYDGDMLNALYGAGIPKAHPNDPLGLAGNVVADTADLLVGDAVRAVVPVPFRWYPGDATSVPWADDVNAILPTLVKPFPGGYITNVWNTTVMASMGELEVPYLESIVNAPYVPPGPPDHPFALIVEGSIPRSWNGRACMVFDNYNGVITNLPWGGGARPVSAWEALIWMARSPNCLFVECIGTCSSYGGIPAGAGNRTDAQSVTTILQDASVATPVVNIPGCPANPDWMMYPVAYAYINGLNLPPLDEFGRPNAIFDGGRQHLCATCSKGPMGTNPALELGDYGCLNSLGCKGALTRSDCPDRQWNRFDDGTKNNWCVGGGGIADARHPCQGCVQPTFPDGMSPFYGSNIV